MITVKKFVDLVRSNMLLLINLQKTRNCQKKHCSKEYLL